MGTNASVLSGSQVQAVHVDRGLGRAVEVVQLGIEPREEAILQGLRQGLAAADDPPEARAVAGPRVLQEQLQHRRHEVDRRDAVLDDRLGEVRAVAMAAGLGDDELARRTAAARRTPTPRRRS